MAECGTPIPYPREDTGVCTRNAGHSGVHRNGLAAINSDLFNQRQFTSQQQESIARIESKTGLMSDKAKSAVAKALPEDPFSGL